MKKKIMESKLLVIFPCFLIIATIFMAVGYASVNSVTSEVTGIATTSPYSGVLITDISMNISGVEESEVSRIDNYSQTLVKSRMALSKTNGSSFVTLTVKVYNNTGIDYYYRGAKYDASTEFYSNPDIVFDVDGITIGDILPSKTEKIFTVNFYYRDNVVAASNILDSFINFEFKKQYMVTYNGLVVDEQPTTVFDGEDLVVSLQYAPVEVIMAGTVLIADVDYSYVDGVLTVPKAKGDIVINCNSLPPGIPNKKDVLLTFNALNVGNGQYSYEITGKNQTQEKVLTWKMYIKVPDDTTIVSNSQGLNSEVRDGYLIFETLGWSAAIGAEGSVYAGNFIIKTSDPNFNIANSEILTLQ